MSNEFLRHLNGNATGALLEFIERFESEGINPNIAWYPSAGDDFRGLLYLTKEYANLFPGEAPDHEQPDIFIMTDYHENIEPERDGITLHSDKQTVIQLISQEELPRLEHAWDPGIVQFEADCGYATMNYIRAVSRKGNIDVTVPVIYIKAVNETFCARHMLPYCAEISHVIHIRYGGGFGGGGRAGGGWIPGVLQRLKTQVYITDDRESMQDGDMEAVKLYPWLMSPYGNPHFVQLREQAAKYWSNHGDVSWLAILPKSYRPKYGEISSNFDFPIDAHGA